MGGKPVPVRLAGIGAVPCARSLRRIGGEARGYGGKRSGEIAGVSRRAALVGNHAQFIALGAEAERVVVTGKAVRAEPQVVAQLPRVVVTGYAGQLSLAHAFFCAVGAYGYCYFAGGDAVVATLLGGR